MGTRRCTLTAAAVLAALALAGCAAKTTPGTPATTAPTATVTTILSGAPASTAPPTTAPPTTAPPSPTTPASTPAAAGVYPDTADDYTAQLVTAWQHDDVARMTDLAGPHVAAHLHGLLPPTSVEKFEDAEDSGLTSVHLVGEQKGLGIDITVDYVDSGLGKPHAIVDIIDNNLGQTVKG